MSNTTTATLDAFRRDGFVVVPGLFDEAEMRRISAWTDELQAMPERPGHCMMYFEPSLLKPGERVLQRIENFCPFHRGFAALCDGDKLCGFAARLFGEPAVLFKDKINFKLPGSGVSLATLLRFRSPVLTPALVRRQRRNLAGMTLLFFVLFYTFPAGMVLYWTSTNAFQLLSQEVARWWRARPATG